MTSRLHRAHTLRADNTSMPESSGSLSRATTIATPTQSAIADASACGCSSCSAWLKALKRGVEGHRTRLRAGGDPLVPAPMTGVSAPTQREIAAASACGCAVCQATLAGFAQGVVGEKANHRTRTTRRAQDAYVQRVAASLRPPQAPQHLWQAPQTRTVQWSGIEQRPWEDTAHYIARCALTTGHAELQRSA